MQHCSTAALQGNYSTVVARVPELMPIVLSDSDSKAVSCWQVAVSAQQEGIEYIGMRNEQAACYAAQVAII